MDSVGCHGPYPLTLTTSPKILGNVCYLLMAKKPLKIVTHILWCFITRSKRKLSTASEGPRAPVRGGVPSHTLCPWQLHCLSHNATCHRCQSIPNFFSLASTKPSSGPVHCVKCYDKRIFI